MKKIVFILFIGLSFLSCKKEFEDHNNISEDVAFSTPAAYKGIVMGMTKDFTTGTLYRIIHAPSFTAKEMGNLSTYETESQLAEGGIELTGINSSISGMWRGLHRNRGVAEKILARIDQLEFPNSQAEADFAAEKSAYKAYAYLFKALTTGYLSNYWEKVTLKNDLDNHATFVSRTEGYQTAIEDLDSALNELNNNTDAITFINGLVSNEFSIVDVIHALKARYLMELGQNQNAYDEANLVDLTKRSVWSYDGGSILNPIYANTIKKGNSRRFSPFENLGLEGAQTPENSDLRVPFYLDNAFTKPDKHCNKTTNNPAGFWSNENSDIPVYLPDEMKLIKAEAKARMGGAANLAEAVSLLNEVRTQDPANDAFGVGGGLAPWGGNVSNQQDVIDEIYKNYAIELFLEGLRFPIHRRFYPNYLDNIDWNTVNRCSLERLNNYYPYPDQERANNPNCPPNPAY